MNNQKNKIKKKKVKKSRKKKQLPKKIISIQNKDKTFQEKWTPTRDELNFPHSTRILITGKVSCGKSTLAKNILVRADPPFKRIIIVHCDAEGTKEYDDLEHEILSEIPDPSDHELFNGEEKTVMILDDIEYDFLPKNQKRNLDRIFGYLSSHKNVTVMLCAQNITNIPPAVRRMSNIFILFKVPDMELLYLIARKIGIKKKVFMYIFDKYIINYHDSFWIDLTPLSPYPYRINGYNIIDLKEIEKEIELKKKNYI